MMKARASFLLLCLATAPGLAAAQTAAPAAATCAERLQTITARRLALGPRGTALDAASAAIDKENAALLEAKEHVNYHFKADVAEYNNAAIALRQHTDQVNAERDAFNAESKSIGADIRAYNADCAGR